VQVDWTAVLPHLFLSGGGLFIFCAGAFWRYRPSNLLFLAALAAVVAAGVVAMFCKPVPSAFSGLLDVGGYTRFFILLFSGITAVTLLFAYHYAKHRGITGDEFYGLILFAALGMSLVTSAVHWLIFFLGLELLSISFYVLIAINKNDPASGEAGIKYFIMGAVASAFLTFGIAMLYSVTGTMNIGKSLVAGGHVLSTPGILLGLSLIMVGMGFKISMVPFHLWTPDVYQGAPAPVTAFLSTGSKVALFGALLRFALYASSDVWTTFLPVLWVLATLTMVAGNIAALSQTRLKRLLAYSSVAHMGYLLMALVAIKYNSAPAIMFYLTVYALMDLGAFGILGMLSAEKADLDDLEDYKGLGYAHPWRSAFLAISLFALAGVPPTAGFIGKFVLFQAVFQAGFVVLGVIGIMAVIISIFFYLKVVVLLYMHAGEEEILVPETRFPGRLACAVVIILLLWLGLLPSSLFEVIARIAPSLPVLS
jgi:NADH-quinone oxidoreductase subunit N